jgi:hypothetical protein
MATFGGEEKTMRISSSKQMSPGMRVFFSRIFPLPFIVVGALTLYFGGRGVHRAKESLAWPVAEGQILNSSVEYHRGSNRGSKGGGTYSAEIRYTFTVDGQVHSGNKVAVGDYGSSNSSHAQKIINRYPRDKMVSVRYLPSDPDVCVLEPGVQAQAWFLPGFGMFFVLVGMLMAVFLPRAMKERDSTEPSVAAYRR